MKIQVEDCGCRDLGRINMGWFALPITREEISERLCEQMEGQHINDFSLIQSEDGVITKELLDFAKKQGIIGKDLLIRNSSEISFEAVGMGLDTFLDVWNLYYKDKEI